MIKEEAVEILKKKKEYYIRRADIYTELFGEIAKIKWKMNHDMACEIEWTIDLVQQIERE